MNNFSKRVLSMFLSLGLILSGGAVRASAAPSGLTDNTIQQSIQERAKRLIEQNKSAREKFGNIDPMASDQKIRVIVEFMTTPNRVSLYKAGTSTLSKITAEQSNFLNKIAGSGIDFEKLSSFKEVFNGTSAIIYSKDLPRILAMDGVLNVYLSQEYEKPKPSMVESVGVINAPFAWNLNYKGEGMVVGVIDSGFDVSHPDFVLTNPLTAKLKPNSMALTNLKGKYLTPKFPYGYNYYDENNIIFESGMSHGQHVAGTVGANGQISGVAPEAQLLALRVFSNDPLLSTTFDDIYLKAMDDGVVLGANAFNLSLGSAAGFSTWTESALDKAVNNANEAGVVVAIANGNDRNLANGSGKTAASWMPDQGLASAPGLTPNSLAVASAEKYLQLYEDYFITFMKNNASVKATILPATGSPDPVDTLGTEPINYVVAGIGTVADFTGKDLTGKVALVSRGTIAFTEKLANAKAAGAIGIIIYNNVVGSLVSMADGDTATIPYLFTDMATGQAMAQLPEMERLVSFGRTAIEKPSIPISSFSTWGSTGDLRLKPEVTAPGSDILSTQNGTGYGLMSGTSMATPHIAGAAAVIRNYIESTPALKNLTGFNKAKLSKLLMMNSATVLDYKEIARSPRVQGAGMLNLRNALETTTLAYDPTTKDGKLELKEISGKSLTLNLDVKNFGPTAQTYTTKVILLTDAISNGSYTELSRNVGFTLTGDDGFTIASDGIKKLNLNVDFSADNITSEQFIEGFVVLTDSNGHTTTVPFMGFYGNWSKPLNLDNFRSFTVPDPDGPSFFGVSGLVSQVEDSFYFYDFADIALNPANPISAETGNNNILPYLSYLRNLDELSFNILGEEKEQLFKIGSANYLKKISNLSDGAPKVKFAWEGQWLGRLQSGFIPDGKYFYEIKSKVNFKSAVPQSKLIPFIVDHAAPVVKNAKISKEGDQFFLTFEATDGPADRSSGVQAFEVSNSLAPTAADIKFPANDEGTYKVDVTSIQQTGGFELYLFAYDNLYNGEMTQVSYYAPEADIPQIYLYEPFDIAESTEVPVFGYIFGINHLDTVQLITGDQVIDYIPTYVANGPVPDQAGTGTIFSGPHWILDTTITMETGYTALRVVAKAKDGTENSIARYIYVDEGAPQLDVVVRNRAPESAKATLDITMTDALPYLRLLQNDEEIFMFDGFDSSNISVTKTLTQEVPLMVGVNTFTFKLMDALDNVTTKIVEISRADAQEKVERIFGDSRYSTAIAVSQKAFAAADTVIIVSGKTAADSLVAGPLSVQMNAPILLIKDGLTNSLTAEIRRLGATNAIIVGGEQAVNAGSSIELGQLGLNVERIGGLNRYETSVLVDAKVRGLSKVTDLAVIANGLTQFDALSMGAAAGKMGVGILLNDGTDISMIDLALKDVTSAFLIGGPAVEKDSVETALINQGIQVERIFGANRYETAVQVAKRFYTDPTHVIVTNGLVAFDALTGAALSNLYNAPLLLNPPTALDSSVKAYVQLTTPEKIFVLGGELAIIPAVKSALEALLN